MEETSRRDSSGRRPSLRRSVYDARDSYYETWKRVKRQFKVNPYVEILSPSLDAILAPEDPTGIYKHNYCESRVSNAQYLQLKPSSGEISPGEAATYLRAFGVDVTRFENDEDFQATDDILSEYTAPLLQESTNEQTYSSNIFGQQSSDDETPYKSCVPGCDCSTCFKLARARQNLQALGDEGTILNDAERRIYERQEEYSLDQSLRQWTPSIDSRFDSDEYFNEKSDLLKDDTKKRHLNPAKQVLPPGVSHQRLAQQRSLQFKTEDRSAARAWKYFE